MQTIGIFNQKGGVGKTTTAITLAHGLALEGHRVLLVDLDAQGNVGDALGLEKAGGLYELLYGRERGAIGGSRRERLDVILSDHSTVEAKSRLMGENFREYRLRDRLGSFSERYEVCVLDTSPGVDVLQVSALVACDAVLTPVCLEHLAVVGAGDLLGTVASLQQVGAFRGRWLGVLPTMWERRTNESEGQLRALAAAFKRLVYPPIPVDARAREAPRAGKTLWEYAPECRALQGTEIVKEGGERVRIGGYGEVLARVRREVLK